MMRLLQDSTRRHLLIAAASLVAIALCSACSLSPNPDLPFMGDDSAIDGGSEAGGDMNGAPGDSDAMGGAGGTTGCLEPAMAGAGGQLHDGCGIVK